MTLTFYEITSMLYPTFEFRDEVERWVQMFDVSASRTCMFSLYLGMKQVDIEERQTRQ